MISPEVLRRYPHFAGIDEGCLGGVASMSEEREFKNGETIFEESGAYLATARIYEKGEKATHLMLLTDGKVDVALTLGTGEKAIVGTLVEGDLMALSALIPPYQLSATGIAKEDGKLIQIEAEPLRDLCEDNPSLGYRLMQGVAKGLMTRLQDTRVELAGQSYAP
ncbi:MAG: cyclic nucleotide-binding domain-containing protein [Anaerolineales bacterium]|nr:cyclic nucleotide-binding domain-containing protein [Anaerolineales bacterium]